MRKKHIDSSVWDFHFGCGNRTWQYVGGFGMGAVAELGIPRRLFRFYLHVRIIYGQRFLRLNSFLVIIGFMLIIIGALLENFSKFLRDFITIKIKNQKSKLQKSDLVGRLF